MSTQLITQLGLLRSSGRIVITNHDQLDAMPDAHALRRAWDRIDLSAIVCVDGKPTVYLKEVQQLRPADIRRYQQFVWNQGIATVLVMGTKTEIHVYSGLVPPADKVEKLNDDHRRITALNRVKEALEVETLIRRIETGQIYQNYPKSFNPDQGVDRYLLRNLAASAKQLYAVDSTVSRSIIHNLLARTIFTCYLIDREIIGQSDLSEAGASDASDLRDLLEKSTSKQAKKKLYKLFANLHETFNGSLFTDEVKKEERNLQDKHVEILRQFLRGDDLGEKQPSLGFWPYDFNFIPIETISAIYEQFLSQNEEDKTERSKSNKRIAGAYYTPRHLAELVVDIATESLTTLENKKVLDPACGSGVFLVALFNRMAEGWKRNNPRTYSPTRWRGLVEILTNNIYGIDKDETACRITCFSLYLALLDHFEPRDIHELAEDGRLLPNLLLEENDKFVVGESRTVLCRNFFDPELDDNISDFDLVIGNPPWIGRNQPKIKIIEKWYRENVQQKLPASQISHAFMWKCPQYVTRTGHVCLVLPTKVIFNKTDEFQEKWFTQHTVSKILQLADLRHLLFAEAKCPSVVVCYEPVENQDNKEIAGDKIIEYVAPHYSSVNPQRGAVCIHPEDTKFFSNTEVIAYAKAKDLDASVLWKTYMRGTPRDLRLLERLNLYPALGKLVSSGRVKQKKRWRIAQGLKPGHDECQTNKKWWNKQHLFLQATSPIEFVLNTNDCEKENGRFKELHRLPAKETFQGPMVLVSQGFTKVAFADFDVLFQDALQSITGPKQDRDFLILLTALLRSRLARYFLFHTAANWGVERDKVHEFELLRLPFPFPNETPDSRQSQVIVEKINKLYSKTAARISNPKEFLNRSNIIQDADEKAEELLYRYFDIDDNERILIEDTNDILIPSATPRSISSDIPTLRIPDEQERYRYAETLCNLLNEWAQRSGWEVEAQVVVSSRTKLGVITLRRVRNPKPITDIDADKEVENLLAEIKNCLPRRTGHLNYLRGVKVFDGDRIHVLKPLALRFWTRTAALNDADELVAAILASPRRVPR